MLARAIYGSFCKIESEIFNVVNYKISYGCRQKAAVFWNYGAAVRHEWEFRES